jgi:cation diffusion facilitator CzcD-associated flavoprotein CzcO
VRFTANFLWMCQGYYDHDKPYTPEWDGFDDYKGEVVHPQHWPEDLDYKNKRVVVIGSGATAATIIPAMADDCALMTMVQRSPTYFYTGENRNELADRLRELDLPEEWVHEIVRKDILKQQLDIQRACVAHPDAVKEELFSVIRGIMGEDFDIDTHFHPSYRPWQQRLAYIPDGDLFHAIKSGKVSVETDHIDRFTEKGLLLKSGKELEADIIITATGFNLSVLGGIPFHVDGKPVDFADTVTYRGIMYSGVPNMAWVFGYLRTSWTMRADLIGDFVCKLLNNMKKRGAHAVTPTLPEAYSNLERQMWIDPEGFNPGYIMRKQHLMPKRIDKEPWNFTTDYYTEKDELPKADLDEDALVYG